MARIESGVEFDKEENHKKLTKVIDTTKPYLLNIPAHLHKKVKRKLVEDERKLRDVLIEYLNKYISE